MFGGAQKDRKEVEKEAEKRMSEDSATLVVTFMSLNIYPAQNLTRESH